MAVRTVTVDLKLNATDYLRHARDVIQINRRLDDSLNDIGSSAAAAGSAANSAGRDFVQMGRRARIAERRVHELREEIDRLIAAQAALAAGGPIPPMIGGGSGGRGGMAGMLMSPAGMGAIGGLVAAAGPAIGAMLGGVLLTALGGISLAPGIIAAIKDQHVKDAWSQFGEFAKTEFENMGEAFEVPLMQVADHLHQRWSSLAYSIRSTLNEMSLAVMPLTEGLTGFIERAGPGLAAGLRGAMPVLMALARELPNLGQAFGDMFKLIAGGTEGAVDGIVALLRILEVGMYALGGWILYLEKIFAFIGNLPDVVKGFLGPLAALTGGSNETDQAISQLGEALSGIEFKVDDTASAFDRLTQSLWALTEGFNSQYGAAIAYEEAIDGLSESVKENGRSMDIGTEKGRNNARALMEVFEAARRTYDANIASGMSAQEAARKYNDQIDAARRAALAAGMAADEVNRLAQAQRNLPTGEKTLVYNVITRFRTEGGPNHNRTPGNQIAFRDGGIVYARDGLMSLGRTSGIASGGRPLIGFAEPGTGGEAFIARNAPAGRSLAIANAAAGWHGGQVVPKGWGGGGTTVIVRPPPTNANREVVDAITSQIRVDVQNQSRGDVQRHFGGYGRL